MRVKVIVLSYNGTGDTLACLENLRRQGHDSSFEVLVVDNGSTDGAPQVIRARYPEFTLVELPENRGWAGGNNVGIERALRDGAELICLLNNDTIIPLGAISALAHAASGYAPCLMHPAIDYADPREGAQLDPSSSVQPGQYALSGSCTPLESDSNIFELDFAYGACLMISAEVFRRVGTFDERFFLQLEETDFYMRARRVGIRSLCATRVRIVHAELNSFGGRATPMKIYYITRNSLLLTEKHRPNFVAACQTIRSLYWSISRVAPLAEPGSAQTPLPAWPFSRNPFITAARAGLRDYLLRRFGPIR